MLFKASGGREGAVAGRYTGFMLLFLASAEPADSPETSLLAMLKEHAIRVQSGYYDPQEDAADAPGLPWRSGAVRIVGWWGGRSRSAIRRRRRHGRRGLSWDRQACGRHVRKAPRPQSGCVKCQG